MREIRPIRRDEADTFLELLCDVFRLDFDRAVTIFYEEPFFDLLCKWALFEGQQMVSVLTTTPLQFGWGNAIGIAGVATRQSRRSEGFASNLIERVLKESEKNGVTGALLFCTQTKVYERAGFTSLDYVIRAPVLVDPHASHELMDSSEVRLRYDAWAAEDPNRLRRDARRWKFWNWSLRVCSHYAGGYVCVEGTTVREVLVPKGNAGCLPAPKGSVWLGTSLMAEQMGLRLQDGSHELVLMGRNMPALPQMFMTDQF